MSVSEGEFVIHLPELGLVAGGESYEDALGELIELVGEQAEDFLDRLDFYMQTDRRGQLAYLLKFALTAPEERHSLFSAAPPPEEPVSRPAETEEAPVKHDAWVIAVLAGELHMRAEQIEGLSEEEAVRLVHEHWARRKE
jgi:hypothetical protein